MLGAGKLRYIPSAVYKYSSNPFLHPHFDLEAKDFQDFGNLYLAMRM